MGQYLNPGAGRFRMAAGSEVFVDKTPMVAYLNSVALTSQRYLCVSRPRRFGKTMAADMLCAYYGLGTDARSLFGRLALSATRPVRGFFGEQLPWDAYLGAFDVVRLTMTEFFDGSNGAADAIASVAARVVAELAAAYPDAPIDSAGGLRDATARVFATTGRRFVVVIDEWDAPFRERREDVVGQRAYLDFLRSWLKDQEFVALAYLTGILPVKKYGAHSALNMFDEYSMVAPLQLAPYTGFTENEVRALCDEWEMDFEAVSDWYDGYLVGESIPVGARRRYRDGEYDGHRIRLYGPLSVVRAMRTGIIGNYWNDTETYEALAEYIRMDFDGLRRTVALLMDGGRARIALGTYQNDMTTFRCADDVLALLIHLGYLGYDADSGEAFVPNREVLDVFRESTGSPDWDGPLREYEVPRAPGC